jgi:DNA-binding response OmpR family regulator
LSKLLLVEDDVDAADMVAEWLRLQNHVVDTVHSGTDAVAYLEGATKYDLVILDWDLPGLTGLQVCQRFREMGGTTPILMLTGRATVNSKEQGLDSGADDYLTKPFDMKELSARIRAILRRSGQMLLPSNLVVGDLQINPVSCLVTRSGEPIALSPKEYSLLEFFARHPNEVFNAEALLERVWSSDSEATPLTVRVCINRLRSKIDVEGKPSVIKNLHGLGYKLETA